MTKAELSASLVTVPCLDLFSDPVTLNDRECGRSHMSDMYERLALSQVNETRPSKRVALVESEHSAVYRGSAGVI
jgi:hypothetical protein